MLKVHSYPYGYKKLLAYQKAEDLHGECRRLTALFPKTKTIIDLADQMDRSARSGKQNIVEGWKRNSTKEYNDFLGFSIGAIAELEEDCDDIWKGIYPEVMGIRGIMGERGKKGAPSSHSASQPFSSTSALSSPSSHFPPFDIDQLKFYPLDLNLPGVVQLKLRCKELKYLLERLQKSLEEKMENEKTFSRGDAARKKLAQQKKGDDFFEHMLLEQGLIKLPDGRVIKKEKGTS